MYKEVAEVPAQSYSEKKHREKSYHHLQRIAATKEISVDAALVTVLSNLTAFSHSQKNKKKRH